MKNKNTKKRHMKIRKNINGTLSKPRLVVFRSNKNTYAQIIDDTKAVTLVSISSAKTSSVKDDSQSKKMHVASEAGEKLATLALKKKITKVVFDRGGYKYHGRIKALAESARKGGLKF